MQGEADVVGFELPISFIVDSDLNMSVSEGNQVTTIFDPLPSDILKSADFPLLENVFSLGGQYHEEVPMPDVLKIGHKKEGLFCYAQTSRKANLKVAGKSGLKVLRPALKIAAVPKNVPLPETPAIARRKLSVFAGQSHLFSNNVVRQYLVAVFFLLRTFLFCKHSEFGFTEKTSAKRQMSADGAADLRRRAAPSARTRYGGEGRDDTNHSSHSNTTDTGK